MEIMQRRGRRNSTSGPTLWFLARASLRRFREATLACGSDTAPSGTSDYDAEYRRAICRRSLSKVSKARGQRGHVSKLQWGFWSPSDI